LQTSIEKNKLLNTDQDIPNPPTNDGEHPVGSANDPTSIEHSKTPSSTTATDGTAVGFEQVTGWKRIAFLTMALILFILGVLGILLPGIPATPFLLVTSYFLARSSPALNEALLRSKFFGPILVDWQVNGGVRRHVKLTATAFVLGAVTLTMAFGNLSRTPLIVVLFAAILGIGVIWWLPTASTKESP